MAEINHATNLQTTWRRKSTLKTFIQGQRQESRGGRLSRNQEDKLDWKSREVQRNAHLSRNQEDKLVLLRTLQQGLYTTELIVLLSTLVNVMTHTLTRRIY